MSEHSKADESRKGLIDAVKGKAKEVAGAVTGNDSL
ncbi:MAG TPA: CsbD family protein, partial [Mycobacterium sp.]|nr:CsbD family protein [Mycobacterium sp.]